MRSMKSGCTKSKARRTQTRHRIQQIRIGRSTTMMNTTRTTTRTTTARTIELCHGEWLPSVHQAEAGGDALPAGLPAAERAGGWPHVQIVLVADNETCSYAT